MNQVDVQPLNDRAVRAKWMFIAVIAIAAYLVVVDVDLTGYLNYLPVSLLLACPLLHLLMHGRHPRHRIDGGPHGRDTNKRNPS
ncbi:MAG: DUF2933 domain-containing protein [Rhodospirillaceae bacterium]